MAAASSTDNTNTNANQSFIDITNAQGETYQGYLSVPESGSGPGVVVIQEIFGINEFIRATADALAGHGYVALAPDLFWRIEAGVSLSYSDEDMARAFELYGQFDPEGAVGDIQGAIDALRGGLQQNGGQQNGQQNGPQQNGPQSGKVGCVGFCLGGLLAWLTAARTDVDCSVSYYGVAIDDFLDDAAKVAAPTILHIAQEDGFVPPEAQQKLVEMAASHNQVEAYVYPGCDHAFATPGRDSFNQEATQLSVQRSLEMFGRVLGG